MFIEKAIAIHSDRYDYSLVNYVNNKTKVKIICFEHGEFEQRPNDHLSGYGCPKCSGKNKLDNTTFIEKAIAIHGDKYDYSLVNYINNKTKVKIICKKHGEFEQRPYNHLNLKQSCPKCSKSLNNFEFFNKLKNKFSNTYIPLEEYVSYKEKIKFNCLKHGEFEQTPENLFKGYICKYCKNKLNNTTFIEKAITIHGDKYDYSLVNYTNRTTKVKIICQIHGEFNQRPSDHLNGCGCPICRESKGEKKIRKYLIKNGINFIPQFRFENCKNKLTLPFDFYLPEFNLCIEYNGIQHYKPVNNFGGSERFLNQIKNDNIKKKYCDNNNIKLLIIKYNDNILEVLINNINIC
jgi:hypothetical protein